MIANRKWTCVTQARCLKDHFAPIQWVICLSLQQTGVIIKWSTTHREISGVSDRQLRPVGAAGFSQSVVVALRRVSDSKGGDCGDLSRTITRGWRHGHDSRFPVQQGRALQSHVTISNLCRLRGVHAFIPKGATQVKSVFTFVLPYPSPLPDQSVIPRVHISMCDILTSVRHCKR